MIDDETIYSREHGSGPVPAAYALADAFGDDAVVRDINITRAADAENGKRVFIVAVEFEFNARP